MVNSRLLAVNFLFGPTSGFASIPGRLPQINYLLHTHVSPCRCPKYHSLFNPLPCSSPDCNFVHCIHSIGTSHWKLSLVTHYPFEYFPLETQHWLLSHWTSLDWNHLHSINGCTVVPRISAPQLSVPLFMCTAGLGKLYQENSFFV